jgi:hypothetical protein
MNAYYAAMLDDTHPSIAFQTSCLNAWPESSNNLAFTLLQNGCVGTIAATRVSWYYIGQTTYAGSHSNAGMAYEFSKRIVNEKKEAGEALSLVKSSIDPGYNWFWQNWLGFNLYGDPSIGLTTCSEDEDEMTTIYESGTGFDNWFTYELTITPAGVRFVFDNPDYLHGMMFTVRNKPDSNWEYGDVVVEWYGVVDQNMSGCMDLTAELYGNGAQINNICTPEINNEMTVVIRSLDGNTNKVELEVFNWGYGPGCQ